MKQPTEQEWQEILGWCGLEIIEQETRFEHQVLYRLSERDTWKPLGSLPIDLNTLFQYAVPKLEDYHLSSCGGNHEANVWGKVIGTGGFWVDDDPALALFWAIKQVMDSEKKVALER